MICFFPVCGQSGIKTCTCLQLNIMCATFELKEWFIILSVDRSWPHNIRDWGRNDGYPPPLFPSSLSFYLPSGVEHREAQTKDS